MASKGGHLRDLAIAGGVVVAILLVLYAYTGNWPPPVVVESNSMMHVDADEYSRNLGDSRADGVPYGRLGTIDPGDLVLVKSIESRDDVDTFANAGGSHYGRPGDVIVYYRFGNEGTTPIIHRAMAWVEVQGSGSSRTYTVEWSETWAEPAGARCREAPERTCTFDDEGITITELDLRNRRFAHSGYITQGDNVVGNAKPDQVLGIMTEPVKLEWVQGVARGELPWFGLIKLVVTDPPHKNNEVADHPYYLSIGKMTAPRDLWVMLLVGLVVVGVAPLGIDMLVHRVRHGRDEEPERPSVPFTPAERETPEPTAEPDEQDRSGSDDPTDPGGRVRLELD